MLQNRPKSLLGPQNFLLLFLLLLPPLLEERAGMRIFLPKEWPQQVVG